MKTKIILTANAEIHDTELREIVEKIWTKMENVNKRTKEHTLRIKKLEKKKKHQNGGTDTNGNFKSTF